MHVHVFSFCQFWLFQTDVLLISSCFLNNSFQITLNHNSQPFSYKIFHLTPPMPIDSTTLALILGTMESSRDRGKIGVVDWGSDRLLASWSLPVNTQGAKTTNNKVTSTQRGGGINSEIIGRKEQEKREGDTYKVVTNTGLIVWMLCSLSSLHAGTWPSSHPCLCTLKCSMYKYTWLFCYPVICIELV